MSNASIFREYDIRGVVAEQIDEERVFAVGAAYGEKAKQNGAKAVSVGRDCRLSSEPFAAALADGITERGVDVVDIGLVSTPMLYFSVFHLTPGGGVIVTASHNPPEYNGLKLCLGKTAMFGDEIKSLAHALEGKSKHARGKITKADITEKYADFLCGGVEVEKGIKFVYDCGNGTGGIAAPLVFEKLGLKSEGLFTEPDGNFPNHHPDPSVEENLAALVGRAGEKNIFGMAFDGDADRLGVVDENGKIVRGDMLALIFALEIARSKPGAKILGDVKCSKLFFELTEKAGGRAIMWKTGHSLMKKKLRDENAEFGGEMSGHLFFGGERFGGYDDALYAGLRLAEIVTKTGSRVCDLLSGAPELFSTPEIRLDCPDNIKFGAVEKAKKAAAEKFPSANIIDIDGVRVEFPDGWGLVRASNTQPALVLRFEAESKKRLEEIRDALEKSVSESVKA